jgi:transcriptional regulator with XRE-family HTH domain
MKDLIKAIRFAANMNQEQFASALGTTTLSINRWENGKTLPNRMAQTQLYNFCKERAIDVAKLIVDTKAYEHTDNSLVLYHGSKKGIIGDIAPISRSECDFGCGFYMGTNTLQPLTLVCNEEKPKFYTVELDMTGLKVLTVEIGMDWAMLIAYYRKEMESAKGTPIYEKYAHMADGYDVIIGYIANDRMYTELSRFFNRTLTDVALINCLSALDLGKQYVAISEKACKQIKILKEEPLSQLELSLLKDMSAERRKEGIALAEEIEVKYRREGKFFDEILKGE